MIRRTAAVTLVLLVPLTIAASDPRGDAVPCAETNGPGDPPDLVSAVGQASEGGSAAVWRLRFAQALRVPDPNDPPFRVDVVLRAPNVPIVSFGNYRDFNRIVRWDATGRDAQVRLLFIPEGGSTVFDPPTIDGRTMTVQMPGRLLLGEDEFRRSALERLRWSVIVRDGGRCDLLGDGVPTLRFEAPPTASPSAIVTPAQTTAVGSSGAGRTATIVAISVAIFVAILVVAYVLRRRR